MRRTIEVDICNNSKNEMGRFEERAIFGPIDTNRRTVNA